MPEAHRHFATLARENKEQSQIASDAAAAADTYCNVPTGIQTFEWAIKLQMEPDNKYIAKSVGRRWPLIPDLIWTNFHKRDRAD